MKKLTRILLAALAVALVTGTGSMAQNTAPSPTVKRQMHNEVPNDKYVPPTTGERKTSPAYRFKGTGIFTYQVNVDANGNNILGDAANEPSIAIDPTNPARMVIGWRQFDHIYSDFRQAGYGYSTDSGQTWTFPGKIEEGIFRSDPVLEADASGTFFYNSLNSNNGVFTCKVFKSNDGGAGWDAGTQAQGGDKQWMVIDKTGGEGNGNIYSWWNSYYSFCYPGNFTRSDDAGASYEDCIEVEGYPYWGNMAIGPEGELYIAGTGGWDGIIVTKSSNAQTPGSFINWDFATWVNVDGYLAAQSPVNPVGLLGQANIGVDCSDGPGRGNVYLLSSVVRNSNGDPGDVMFAKSTDGGETFGPAIRLNDDAASSNYQWFGTMSVAPGGRIDAVWLDTRESPPGLFYSALYYTYSTDQGETWSANELISDAFDPTVGYPVQMKMGDYFDMESDDVGASLAWANTFNGEQDVYFSRIIPQITGIGDQTSSAASLAFSCSPNPVSNRVTIRYANPADASVNLTIRNLCGEPVCTIVNEHQQPGNHTIVYDASGLPAGYYLCTLKAGSLQKTISLIRL